MGADLVTQYVPDPVCCCHLADELVTAELVEKGCGAGYWPGLREWMTRENGHWPPGPDERLPTENPSKGALGCLLHGWEKTW